VDPSSLIFLAIIAMWAAYLLGHWVRRRDQLATARSIDRFSESMRVLERRTPTRPVSAARPTARAYVVAPVRGPAATGRRGTVVRPSAIAAGGRSRVPSTVATVATVAVPGTSSRRRISREAARRRGRLVVGLLTATMLAWLLAAVTALVWWPAALVTGLLAVVLVQMRRTVRAAAPRRARHSTGRRPRRRNLAARVPAPSRRPRRHHQDVRSVVEQVAAARRAQQADASAARPASTPDDDPQRAQNAPEPMATGAHAARLGASEEVVGGWQPVPVPPPTYTLKPKARPPVRRPAPAVEAPDVMPVRPPATRPASPAFDLDEILERRIAAGG
jgi:hypothetical protein